MENKTEKAYSFVIVLCRKGGTEVVAIRKDGCKNKAEAIKKAMATHKNWNMKSAQKLEASDFREE